jgi:hypothetical protein
MEKMKFFLTVYLINVCVQAIIRSQQVKTEVLQWKRGE